METGNKFFMTLMNKRKEKEIRKPEPVARKNVLDKYQQLINELRVMSQIPSSYTEEREKMASMLGEIISLSFYILKEEKQKRIEAQEKINELIMENQKMKQAMREILSD